MCEVVFLTIFLTL